MSAIRSCLLLPSALIWYAGWRRCSLQVCFRQFDTSSDGTLDRGELHMALTQLGLREISERQVELLSLAMDWNADGTVGIEDFIRQLYQRRMVRLHKMMSAAAR